jgi:hypothetical protein
MSRYIDADAMKEWLDEYLSVFKKYDKSEVKGFVEHQPSIDIVRCQDCKYWVYNFNGCARNPCTEPWYATDFCNYGERSRR